MFKNKYVLVIGVGLASFALAALAGIFLLGHDSKDAQTNLSAASESGTSSSNQPVTLSQDAMTGPQISANSNTGTALSSGSGSGSASADASKLLDPTTFGQYDKYKTSQTAQYIDLQKGDGAVITGGSQVTVVYKGWLTNGTLFDGSKTTADGKLEAFSFTEGQHQVIPGWESALEGAKSGGVRLLIIPPALGYGAAGQGPIPGDSVLVFQVQIVQVK